MMTTTATTIGQKELPAGWKWVKLGDFCEHITKGSTPTTYGFSWEEEGIVFLRSECVLSSGLSLKGSMHISEAAHAHMKRSRVTTGDVLLRITGDIGQACVVPNELDEGNINQHIARVRIRAEAEIDTNYLVNLLNSPEVIQGYHDIERGATHPHLSLGQVRNTPIPLPPLGEQKRIAGILNEQMAAVEEAKKAAQERLEAAKALPAAYLREVFPSSEDELPAGWKWVKLGDVCELEDGDRGKNYPSRSEYVEKGIPFVNATQIDKGVVSQLDMNFITVNKFQSLGSGMIQPWDFLFCLRGSIGKFASVQGMAEGAIASNLIIIRCGHSITHDFMKAYLSSDNCKHMIEGFKSGSAQPNLSAGSLLQFTIPLPPLGEQKRIASDLDDKIAGVKLAEASIQQELDTIGAMPAALLRKAFSGGL